MVYIYILFVLVYFADWSINFSTIDLGKLFYFLQPIYVIN